MFDNFDRTTDQKSPMSSTTRASPFHHWRRSWWAVSEICHLSRVFSHLSVCLSVCARDSWKVVDGLGNIYSDSRLGPTQETIGVKFSSQNSTTDNFLSATKFKVITFLFIYLFYLMNLLASINISITIKRENTGQMVNTGYNHLRVANAVN